jgi:hypothetical protein
VRRALWIDGPHHGEWIDLPDARMQWIFPVEPPPPTLYPEDYVDTLDTVVARVERTRGGNWLLVWPQS